MDFHVLTLFPDMIRQGLGTSITGRALRQNRITLETVDIRDYSDDKHRRVDDYTYGGGAGMLMRTQPVFDAWAAVRNRIPADHQRVRTIYVTPQGYPFTQRMAEDFSKADDLIFICGHYEGIDERVLEETVTDYVSIGDYVLTGGELAAMVMIDATARLVPGVLHNESSAETESFHGSLLEYPQYSRPEEWHGKRVPEVLLSGNQKEIDKWRLEQSLIRTRERRPDLYAEYSRIREARNCLMKNKLLNAPMITLIDRGMADLLFMQDGSVCIRSLATGILYFRNPTESEEAEKHFEECRKKYAAEAGGEELLYQRSLSPDNGQAYTCWVLTRREKLPVTGLYRPDGKPNASGIVIRKQEAPEICPETESDPMIRSVMASGNPFWLAFCQDQPAGIISATPDGCITGLYVKPEYRRRHIGMALETCACNALLETAGLPWILTGKDQEALAGLQKKLGLYPAKGILEQKS